MTGIKIPEQNVSHKIAWLVTKKLMEILAENGLGKELIKILDDYDIKYERI